MTRRDFEALAAMLRHQWEAAHSSRRTAPGAGEVAHSCGRAYAVHQLAESIATHCASRNLRFDRARFLAACGVQS